MNFNPVIEFALRSLAVGGIAWLVVAWVPLSRPLRTMVTVGALLAMAFAMFDWFAPLPRISVWHGPTAADSLTPVAPALGAIWLSGLLLFVVRDMTGLVRLQGIIRRSLPMVNEAWQESLATAQRALSLRQRVELRISNELSPCAAGWLRPVILLPAESLRWTRVMREQVLLHELGHVRRGDLWLQLAARLITACHWFNPFAHALWRQLETERELACDELVVRHHGSAPAYAECLLAMATRPRMGVAMPTLALLPRGRSQLEVRIGALFAELSTRSRGRRVLEAGGCCAALVVLAACSVSGPATTPDDEVWTSSEVEHRLAADPFPGER